MNRLKFFACLIIFTLILTAFVSCNGAVEESASVGEVVEWPFECEGGVDDLSYEISDTSLAEIIHTTDASEELSRPRKIAKVRALGEGEVTITVTSSADKGFEKKLALEIKRDPTVIVGEGVLTQEISIENTDAELYTDDTTVTYNITTSKLVDSITLTLFDSTNGYVFLNSFEDARKVLDENTFCVIYSLTVDKDSLTDGTYKTYDSGKNGQRYSSSRTENGDSALWEIKWNVGNSAVKFVEILATDADTGTNQSSIAHLNIHYPTISSQKSLEEVVALWVSNNVDGPLYFSLDTSDMTNAQKKIHYDEKMRTDWAEDDVIVLMGLTSPRSFYAELDSPALKRLAATPTKTLYDAMFDASAIYRDNFAQGLMGYAMVSSLDCSNPSNLPTVNENVLAGNFNYDKTYAFYYPITDEIRAVIAYQNGAQIDKTLFPYAHSILERATEVLNEIIEPDMTDFEKEREIYAWMVKNQQNQIQELDPDASAEHRYACTKTAYGFLNGYGGDCMGYSGTFFTLCNMVGVECSTVDASTLENGEVGGPSSSFSANHRFNLVRLDGEYYFVEAFWFYQKNDPSEGDFRFMNMTTENAKNHYVWADDSIFGPPECNYSTYLVDENTCELKNK